MDTNSLPPAPAPDPAVQQVESPPPVPLTTPIHRESPLRDVFVGPNGLYPGTRWLIYLAMFGVTLVVLGTFERFLRSSYHNPMFWMMVSEIMLLVAAILPGFVMARIEDKPFGEFGLPARGAFQRNFWVGTLWGIVSLSALILMLRVAGAFEFGSFALNGTRIVKFAIYYAVFFLLTGFAEEFLLRGYSQWILSRGMHFWPAAALLSVGFGAIHAFNPGESKIGLAAVCVIGFFFCLTLRRTGNLWWAVGFHMSWDWGESYLYSVPDSGGMFTGHLLNSSFKGAPWLTGGSVGPEGSVLAFVVLIAMWVLFDRMYPEARYRTD